MKEKIKVLIVYNRIWSYRIKIFELLNEKYDLTVSFINKKSINQKYNFKTIYLPTIKLGPVSFHKNNLLKISKQYDVIIGLSDIRWLTIMLLGFIRKRKYKLIYWGIGVRASYDHKFDEKTYIDNIRYFLTKRADALIFYSSYPLKKYVNAGFLKEKLFVANNTVNAPFSKDKDFNREYLLFIGTLYAEKGIKELLLAYKQLIDEGNEILPLKIVGGGEKSESIKKWVEDNNLKEKIILTGPIYNSEKLEKIFRSSVACISPNQAGLSVLSSMAYGCIFITNKEAITGGEIFNIKNMENGILYEGGIEELKSKILLIHNDSTVVNLLSKNAFNHYRNHRSPQMMANEISNAIEYSLNN